MESTSLEERIGAVRARIERACDRSGRDSGAVSLIAVSKTVGRAAIDEAYALGIRDFGESRVQAAAGKLATPLPVDARMHMIGSLQSNKAATAVELFDIIHSVDRPSLIDALQRHSLQRGRVKSVLLQVNIAGEEQKAGCEPERAAELAEMICGSANLQLIGLMTMAPLVDDADDVRAVFRGLTTLRARLCESGIAGSLPVLSMGMTNDFEVAIEEGATHIRVGRAIFGDAPPVTPVLIPPSAS